MTERERLFDPVMYDAVRERAQQAREELHLLNQELQELRRALQEARRLAIGLQAIQERLGLDAHAALAAILASCAARSETL
jgi:hypothetical protein